MKPSRKIFADIHRSNPAALLILGICPALAVTDTLQKALAMGAATIFVTTFSNLLISIVRKQITDTFKILIFFVITAAITSIADIIMQAFFPGMSKAIGIYVPLIAVHGLVLQRAEHFAMKNKAAASFFDGIYTSLLFAMAIIITASLREMAGSGSLYGIKLVNEQVRTLIFISLPPGAFIMLGFIIAAFRKLYPAHKN